MSVVYVEMENVSKINAGTAGLNRANEVEPRPNEGCFLLFFLRAFVPLFLLFFLFFSSLFPFRVFLPAIFLGKSVFSCVVLALFDGRLSAFFFCHELIMSV
ncbi:MAG: hypothetical protein LBG80_11865 [Bacteroidales bacterium]|jgi:hypothetical protein|nr:hypothetical protein [Bacteroidales bacterium]